MVSYACRLRAIGASASVRVSALAPPNSIDWNSITNNCWLDRAGVPATRQDALQRRARRQASSYARAPFAICKAQFRIFTTPADTINDDLPASHGHYRRITHTEPVGTADSLPFAAAASPFMVPSILISEFQIGAARSNVQVHRLCQWSRWERGQGTGNNQRRSEKLINHTFHVCLQHSIFLSVRHNY